MGGQKGASHKRVELVLKLPQLQNLIKRDPPGYKEEFKLQHRNYVSELDILRLKPGKDGERFAELVTFLSHVAPCYKKDCQDIPKELMTLLEEHGTVINPSLRVKLVQALVLLRNRDQLNPTDLLQLFFKLFRIPDKNLRQLLFDHTVNDIRNINLKSRNEKMNKILQAFMYTMLRDENPTAAKKSLDVMIMLYRKRVWTDAHTVNVIASALENDLPKLRSSALHFFLNIDATMEDEEDEEIKAKSSDIQVNMHQHARKTGATERKIRKQIKERKKKLNSVEDDKSGLFPAINLLNDPLGSAEKVFKRLRVSNERFEIKLLMMNFISRVIGSHQLLILPFYSFLQRYILSNQREITHIMAYLVQACHSLVPPDDILPIIKCIAFNFVTERCTGDVMAVGINVIKEIIRRIPSILSEADMDAFVQDLAEYSHHRDKSVVVAARGFTNFVREVYPSLLRKKDRGKFHDISAKPMLYGEVKVLEGVEGAELLTMENRNADTYSDDGSEMDENCCDSEDSDEESLLSNEDSRNSDFDQSDCRIESRDDKPENKANVVESAMDCDEVTNIVTKKMKIEQKDRVDVQRILTEKDFAKIRRLKAQAIEQRNDPRLRKASEKTNEQSTNSNESDEDENADNDDNDENPALLVNASDLEGYKKRRRATLEERLETKLIGQEEFKKRSHAGGLTNTEKERKKNFLMVRKKRQIREKHKDSGVKKARVTGKNKQKKVQMKHDKRKKRRT